MSWLGEGRLLPESQRDVVWSGLAGLSWRAFGPSISRFRSIRTPPCSTAEQLDFLERVDRLTVGGVLRFRSGWRLELGVTEDLAVETTPDVVFVLGVHREHQAD